MTGLLSMIIACAIFYFDTRSSLAYILFAIGFVLVGIGILLGFAKMVSDDQQWIIKYKVWYEPHLRLSTTPWFQRYKSSLFINRN